MFLKYFLILRMSIAETNQKLQISEDYFLIAALTTKYEKMDKWRQWSQWAFRHLLKFKPIMSKKCALWRLILAISVNYIISVFISPSFYYHSPARWLLPSEVVKAWAAQNDATCKTQVKFAQCGETCPLAWKLISTIPLLFGSRNVFFLTIQYIWYREEHTLIHQLL